jgi:predicted AAA+ superfamily ATPase
MNEQFERLIARVESLMARIESVLPQPLTAPDWSASVAYRYRKRSSGHGSLEPVRHIGNMSLGDLKEIEDQKEKIKRNTEQFVLGKPANNVLLTGARGTGKSSLIKACLNEYSSRGLRLIEVDKADLTDLPDIVDVVSGLPEKFIVFCDDLSFEEGEPGYKALKSILDGSVAAATPNVLIYATSNRRHLLPEYMTENLTYTRSDDGEVHPGEVVEEKISLSERFGLWVSFYPFQPGRIPDHRRAVAVVLRRGPGCDCGSENRPPWSGRWSAARAAAVWPTSSPATMPAATVPAGLWRHRPLRPTSGRALLLLPPLTKRQTIRHERAGRRR